MASSKLFKGIAHDIAHHAASGLSYLHPHLGEACESIGTETVMLDLLSESPYAQGFPVSQPLNLATGALRKKFAEMVEHAQLNVSQLRRAVLHFRFPSWRDHYSCAVKSEFELLNGHQFSHVIE